MARNRSSHEPEPTQPGNPHSLTKDQHVHSAAAIARFGDAARKDRVHVLHKDTGLLHPAHPKDKIFCALRVWSQWVEGRRRKGKKPRDPPIRTGLFLLVEDAFQRECDAALASGTVANHEAVTEYFSIWRVRSMLAEQPPSEFKLEGFEGSSPGTKDHEEVREKKQYMFHRSGVVPARLVASTSAVRQHARNMLSLRGTNWGVLRASGSASFVCPDRPGDRLLVPIDRKTALAAGHENRAVSDEDVREINRASFALALDFVFGYPDDVDRFARDGRHQPVTRRA